MTLKYIDVQEMAKRLEDKMKTTFQALLIASCSNNNFLIMTSSYPKREGIQPNGFDSTNKISIPYEDWDTVLVHWTPRRLLATLGWCNKLLYNLCTEVGALVKQEDGKHSIIKSSLQRLLRNARHGVCEIRLKLKGFTEYLQAHWPGACSDRKTTRSIRTDLAALGLFEMEGQGIKGETFVPNIINLDLELLLLFYRRVEEIFLSKTGGSLDKLPKHRGSTVVRLFNAVFQGRTTYREHLPHLPKSAVPEEKEEDRVVKALWNGEHWLTIGELQEAPFQWSEEGWCSWIGHYDQRCHAKRRN